MSKVGDEGSFRLLLLCTGNALDLLLVRLLESHPWRSHSNMWLLYE